MSRIAGIVCDEAGSQHERTAADLLTAVQSSPSWVGQVHADGRAALGWCGRSGANAAAAAGWIAVLDGTIYNRADWQHDGNDAELLLRLALEHGLEAALQRINGDFAAALYDCRRGELWLARDRFGVRPLYYALGERLLGFASRPGPLLTLPGVRRSSNRQFVAMFAGSHYRYFDNDDSASPFADVRQVPPAAILRIRNGAVTASTYWSLSEAPDLDLDDERLAEQYRELLADAVNIRLRRADRPLFTLSGGMDSSSVLASAVRGSGRKQHAVSTVYQDKTYDESAEIATILSETVEQWHQVHLDTPDVFALVPKLIAAHDEPVATATWLSHYLLCERAAADGFGSLFGGLGGDELNAGEYEYFFFHFADLRAAGEETQLRHEVEKWVEYHDHPVFQKNYAVMESGLQRMTDGAVRGRCVPDRRRLLRYAAALNPAFFDLAGFQPRMDHPFSSCLKNRTYQDLTRETIPCCLRAEDRQSAAFGLENFLPFLDHRLAEFMFRVPGRLKIRDGVTKQLLRRAMKGVLPEETRTRIKKTGWNAPAHVWFSGGCRDQLLDMIRSRRFRERGVYQAAEVERLAADHARIVAAGTNEDNHMMFFWQLVNLELWFQAMIDAPAVAHAPRGRWNHNIALSKVA